MGIQVRFLVAVALLLFSRESRGESDNALFKGIETLFAEIGFAPACVAKTLALCENSKTSFPSLDILEELKSIKNIFEIAPHKKHLPRNCADLFEGGDKKSGVRTIYPYECSENRAVSVFCDQTSEGGGWTVFQHRENLPQREDFSRKWTEYKLGFGNLTGEFWLGLENIRALVKDNLMELKVDLEDYNGEKKFAKYEYFYINDASDKYRLDIGKYSGDAGDSFSSHSGQKFSTMDQDNDSHKTAHCSQSYKGGWWYGGCHSSNLNGYQYVGNHTSYADGINWKAYTGYHYSLKKTSLSLRPRPRF